MHDDDQQPEPCPEAFARMVAFLACGELDRVPEWSGPRQFVQASPDKGSAKGGPEFSESVKKGEKWPPVASWQEVKARLDGMRATPLVA